MISKEHWRHHPRRPGEAGAPCLLTGCIWPGMAPISMVLSTVQYWWPMASYGDGYIGMVGAAAPPLSAGAYGQATATQICAGPAPHEARRVDPQGQRRRLCPAHGGIGRCSSF